MDITYIKKYDTSGNLVSVTDTAHQATYVHDGSTSTIFIIIVALAVILFLFLAYWMVKPNSIA